MPSMTEKKNPLDANTKAEITSEMWMKEEIERLQAENIKLKAEVATPGKTFKEQWVRDPDVPERIMDGDFHDVSTPPDGVSSQRMRAPGTFDPLAVSETLAKRMGINSEIEEPVWRRKDNWQGLGVNDVEEFMDHNEGGQVCISNGKMHHRGDLVLCKRLKKYGSQLVNERINQAAAEDAKIYPHKESPLTEGQQLQIREENRDALKGILAGSITSGMSLERAGQIHTVEEIRKIKDRYLYAGRTKPSGQTVANAADRLNDNLKGAVKGRGGSYGVNISFDPTTGKRIA